MTQARILPLTSGVETIQTDFGTFLNPYNLKLMNVVTNLVKFMTKDTLYVGIQPIKVPITNVLGQGRVEIDESRLYSDSFVSVLDRDVNGGASAYSVVTKLESKGLELENGVEATNADILDIYNSPKLKNEDFVLDIASMVATFLGQDYQDPGSFYIKNKFIAILINRNWYFGQVSDTEVIIFDFISRQRLYGAMIKPAIFDEWCAKQGLVAPQSDMSLQLKPTRITTSWFEQELPKEELLTTEYNPIISSIHLDKIFGNCDFGTNTALNDGIIEEIVSLNNLRSM